MCVRERKNPESSCIDGLLKCLILPYSTTTRAFYYCEAKTFKSASEALQLFFDIHDSKCYS